MIIQGEQIFLFNVQWYKPPFMNLHDYGTLKDPMFIESKQIWLKDEFDSWTSLSLFLWIIGKLKNLKATLPKANHCRAELIYFLLLCGSASETSCLGILEGKHIKTMLRQQNIAVFIGVPEFIMTWFQPTISRLSLFCLWL